MGMSPHSFYRLTVKEIELILEGYENERKDNYEIMLQAFFNAIGLALDNKFKPVSPFDSKKDRKLSHDQREDTLKMIKELDKKFGRSD